MFYVRDIKLVFYQWIGCSKLPWVANIYKNCQVGSLNYLGGIGFLKIIWYSIKLYIEIFQMPIEVWKQTPVSGFLNILLILHLFSVGFWNIRPFLCWMQKKGLLCYANYRKMPFLFLLCEFPKNFGVSPLGWRSPGYWGRFTRTREKSHLSFVYHG